MSCRTDSGHWNGKIIVDGMDRINVVRMEDNSMSPAYGNGDLLACKNVSGSNFIQWGKTHVIDTAQGVMIKRLFDCEDDKDAIACTSDNPRFPRFLLHLEDIISISMVVGSIKFE